MKNKVMCSILGLLVLAGIATAAVSLVNQIAFSATGQSATWTLPAKAGSYYSIDMVANVQTAGVVTVYNGSLESKLHTTMSSATALIMYTDSSNVLGGVTISTNDFLLVDDGGTYTLANISAIAGEVTNTAGTVVATTYTVGSMSATAGAKIYVCDLADIVTIPIGAANNDLLKGITVGKYGMPMHFVGGAAVGPASYFLGVANAMKP